MSESGYEQDEYWMQYKHFFQSADAPSRVAFEVNGVVKLLELSGGMEASVLDLGCGTGRHSLELARRGYRVTGIDRTLEYIEECKRRAETEGLPIEFVCQDMLEFRRKEGFDAVECLFSPFGSFGSREADKQLLRNIQESLRDDGRMIIDVVGKEVVALNFQPRVEYSKVVSSERVFMSEERRILHDWSTIQYRRTFRTNCKASTFSMDAHLYSGSEFRELIEDVGFFRVELFGNHGGAPYDQQATRLVAIACKADRGCPHPRSRDEEASS